MPRDSLIVPLATNGACLCAISQCADSQTSSTNDCQQGDQPAVAGAVRGEAGTGGRASGDHYFFYFFFRTGERAINDRHIDVRGVAERRVREDLDLDVQIARAGIVGTLELNRAQCGVTFQPTSGGAGEANDVVGEVRVANATLLRRAIGRCDYAVVIVDVHRPRAQAGLADVRCLHRHHVRLAGFGGAVRDTHSVTILRQYGAAQDRSSEQQRRNGRYPYQAHPYSLHSCQPLSLCALFYALPARPYA